VYVRAGPYIYVVYPGILEGPNSIRYSSDKIRYFA